ncbi:ABC transporter substrate-binding protein [Enterocloster asparagiformis]|uniref:ABC transporter substrate-binding protein n=1 Tax=Enterocloster asparagiformis TaxID=333367 RepID=UPI002A81601F|nr:ABC transporter substrate-binding protein [Enterocloster asparagiformis]
MRKNCKRWLSMAMAVLMTGSLLSGCSGSSGGTTTVAQENGAATQASEAESVSETQAASNTEKEFIEGGSVTIACSTDCSNVAAWRLRSPFERLNWSGIYEPLFRMNDDGTVKECLATALDSDYENLTYTIHLRDDVKFSDGSPLNADVVVWNFENFKENSQSSAVHFSKVESFEKIDDYTVAIHLNEWTSQMPFSLADVAGIMYSKKAFDENGYDWCMENPVGTGPYMLDKWVKDEYKTLVRNENYWNKDSAGHLDSYDIRVIADQTAAENALKAGEIDAYYNGNTMFQNNMLAQGYQEFANTARYNGYFIIFASAVENSPMSDARVRKAICYAIDSQAICDSLGFGIDTYSGQYAAPGSSFYVDGINKYEYNVEKAKELLAEAGYPDGFTTTIYTGNELHLNDYMVVLQGYLKDIGIDAKLEYADNAEWSGTIMYDIPEGMTLISHGFDNNIINQAYSNFALSNEGNGMLNKCKIVPENLKEALDRAMAAPDNDTMMNEWKTAIKILFDDECLAYTICHAKASRIICNDRIVDMGWISTACNYMDFTKLAVCK